MPEITDETLAELERLEKSATAGPWFIEGAESGPVKVSNGTRSQRTTEQGAAVKVDVCRVTEQYMNRGERIANAELIAAMRNALPSLLAELRAARVNDARYRTRKQISFDITGFPRHITDALREATYRKDSAAYDAAIDAAMREKAE